MYTACRLPLPKANNHAVQWRSTLTNARCHVHSCVYMNRWADNSSRSVLASAAWPSCASLTVNVALTEFSLPSTERKPLNCRTQSSLSAMKIKFDYFFGEIVFQVQMVGEKEKCGDIYLNKSIYPGKGVMTVDLHFSNLLLYACVCVSLDWLSVCTWSFSRCQTNQGKNSGQCRETVVIVSWWIFNSSLASAPVTLKVTTVKTIWNISRGVNGGSERMCVDNSQGTSRNILIESESLVVVRYKQSIRAKLVSIFW